MCLPLKKKSKTCNTKKKLKKSWSSSHSSILHDNKEKTTQAGTNRGEQWDDDSNKAVISLHRTNNKKEDNARKIREDHWDRIFDTSEWMDTQKYINNKDRSDYSNTSWEKTDGYHGADHRFREYGTPERNETHNYKTRSDYSNTRWKNIESNGNIDSLLSQVTTESVIGIFSRSAKSNYKWLKGLLEPRVKHVESNFISSNNMKFREATRKCNFGILYHTSTSGRINITDVIDSLYDEELKYMSEKLGKKNVVVLVDDLNESTDQEKGNILQCQPSIAQYAKDLILVSKTEKRNYSCLMPSTHDQKIE